MKRAREISDTTGLKRADNIVRGALPMGYTSARFIEKKDLGVTSPVRPTTITRLPAGETSTVIYSSPLRQSVTYSNPVNKVVTETVSSVGVTSPIRVSRVVAPQTAVSNVVISPARVSTTVNAPRVSTVISPARAVTEFPPRFVGSTNLASSRYIPSTIVRQSVAPVTTTVTTETKTEVIPSTTIKVDHMATSTIVNRTYSPSKIVSHWAASPTRVRIDSKGVTETFVPQVVTTSQYF